MLTGQEILDSNMLKGAEKENVQQQGVDIRISKIYSIGKNIGVVPKEGKTQIPQRTLIEPLHYKNGTTRIHGWMLSPGTYDIEFIEGTDIDSCHCMKPLTRSSLVRCGSRIDSGLYDAGFKTEHAGAMLFVNNPILIEVGARVAQIVCYESGEVDNLYDGQFQGDKQRGGDVK